MATNALLPEQKQSKNNTTAQFEDEKISNAACYDLLWPTAFLRSEVM